MFFDDLIDKLKNFPKEEMVQNAVKNNQKFVVNLNREQMLDGKDANDAPITPGYAASTKERKRRLGQPTNKVTFFEQGEFHGKMFLKDDREGIEIDSNSNTTKFLVKRSGSDIFGITDKNADKIGDKILPELQRETFLYLIK